MTKLLIAIEDIIILHVVVCKGALWGFSLLTVIIIFIVRCLADIIFARKFTTCLMILILDLAVTEGSCIRLITIGVVALERLLQGISIGLILQSIFLLRRSHVFTVVCGCHRATLVSKCTSMATGHLGSVVVGSLGERIGHVLFTSVLWSFFVDNIMAALIGSLVNKISLINSINSTETTRVKLLIIPLMYKIGRVLQILLLLLP